MSKRPWLFLYNFLVVSSIVILGTSCEGNTDRYYYVVNKTDDTIYFKTFYWDYFGDSIQIDTFLESNTALTYYTVNSRGGSTYLDDLPGRYFYNWLITRKTLPDTHRLDWQSDESWGKELIELSTTPSNIEHHYRFEVNEKDFK